MSNSCKKFSITFAEASSPQYQWQQPHPLSNSCKKFSVTFAEASSPQYQWQQPLPQSNSCKKFSVTFAELGWDLAEWLELQCRDRNSGFDPSTVRYSGIWEAADEVVYINVHKKNSKIPLLTFAKIRQQLNFVLLKIFFVAECTTCVNNEIRCSFAIMRKNSTLFYLILCTAEEERGGRKISRKLPLNEKRVCDHLYICWAFVQLQNLWRQSL